MQGVACVCVEGNQKVCVHAAVPLVVHGGQCNAHSLPLAAPAVEASQECVQLGALRAVAFEQICFTCIVGPDLHASAAQQPTNRQRPFALLFLSE